MVVPALLAAQLAVEPLSLVVLAFLVHADVVDILLHFLVWPLEAGTGLIDLVPDLKVLGWHKWFYHLLIIYNQ